MSNNAIAFLSGLGGGYLAAKEKGEKQKRDDEDRALRNEAAQLQIDASKKQVADQRTIALAGAPVAMTEGAGGMLKPDAMDNRDVGLPENAELPNQGLQAGGFSVNGKGFADRGTAQAAVTAANTPDAINERVLAAQRGIDPVKALSLQKDITQGKVADVQAADVIFRSKLGAAMASGHDGLAKLISDSESSGMAEHKLKAVVSADGKTVTYNKVGADGKLTPTPLTFSNDETGVTLAAYRLDQSITPEKRMDFALKLRKEDREGRESDSKTKLQTAQAGYYDAAAGLKDATDPNAKGGSKPLVDRMSEIDKATLVSINKQREKIQDAVTKGLAEGSYDEKGPGAKSLQAKLAALSMQERVLQDRYREGTAPAADPLGMKKPAAGARPVTLSTPKSGQVDILNQEWAKAQSQLASAKTLEEKTRAEGDLSALTREYKNLKASPPGAPAAPAPVQNVAAQNGAVMKPPVPQPVAPVVAAPVANPAELMAMAQAENMEMASGKRLQYSPQVAAFVAQQQAAKDAAAQAESKAYRQREFQKSNMAAKGIF